MALSTTRLTEVSSWRLWCYRHHYMGMKKVYTIVLYEKTEGDFKDPMLQGAYIHHGKTRFDTSLKLNLLQEYFLIALDVFGQNGYTKSKELDDLEGWLSILTAETIADVERVIRCYPWSEPIFHEMSAYVNNPEEVILMFSEALKIADRNTVKYMIEELQDRATQAEESQKQEAKKRKLAEENQKLAEEKQKLAEESQKQEAQMRMQAEAELQRSQEEVAQLKALLAKKQ